MSDKLFPFILNCSLIIVRQYRAKNMDDYITYLQEVFSGMGTISAKRMFGGHGLYYDSLMFSLVADGVVYLKADAENAQDFEALGLGKFQYEKSGKLMAISYYQAPDELFDDPQLAERWARKAWNAAVRGDQKKRKPKQLK